VIDYLERFDPDKVDIEANTGRDDVTLSKYQPAGRAKYDLDAS